MLTNTLLQFVSHIMARQTCTDHDSYETASVACDKLFIRLCGDQWRADIIATELVSGMSDQWRVAFCTT